MSTPVSSGPCAHCGSEMWLPQELYSSAKRSEKITFYCPYGHPQHYPQGDSETIILRRERDLLKQRLAEKDDHIRDLSDVASKRAREIVAMKAQEAKVRKRAAAGTCPCCHRTFRQMALHMRKQHPEFKVEAVA